MSALRNLVDKIKPTFTKGGKLGFLESTFDAFETFLFVPNTTTQKGAHIRDCNDMKRTMIMVVVALMPALLFGFYNTGYMHFLSQGVQPEFWASLWFGFLKVLPLIVVSYVVGLGIEFAFAQFRGHEVNEGFLVSGLLIPMIMPVDIPLWMVALSTAFAVVFGKEVFGGTGMNVFNPALLARAFAFFAYTPSMSGAILLFTGVASWRTMVSVFVGGLAMGYLFQALGVTTYPAWWHLIVGGFAFGAVFMATDPVTSAQTDKGKYIVGLMTGALAVLIRVVNPAYPEGMMLSILFMNALAPLVDYYVVEANISRRKKRVKLAK